MRVWRLQISSSLYWPPYSFPKWPTEAVPSGREVVVFRVLPVCLLSPYSALPLDSDPGDRPQLATKVALAQSRPMTELNRHQRETWTLERHDVSIVVALRWLRACL